ncbi:MAG: enoyl-CoA hydratase-related protein [Chloroflexota bacterium]|jgi:enoyl-CoA hydratase/carnithine racemase|nr:enoyl-CoA hydratase-related protein [Chloroflexota bacterium]|tara:strand:- start:351 stop:1166 length:816 start_codon:yes stop_codon:yes gene_type:complete
MTKQEDVLVLEKPANGRIWVMRLNRPERLNSFNGELRKSLYEAFWDFAHDDEAWVAILTGTGRAFCTGQDLKERTERNAAALAGEPDPMVQLPDYLQDIYPLSEKLNCWKPIIAAVNGLAVAGGFNAAMQCDVRIASSDAEFGIAEVRWNQGAAWVHHLPKIIGLANALELTLWGDKRISAERAKEWGFVNEVVAPEDLMPTAMDWAERMLTLAPRSVRNLKEILYRGMTMGPAEAQRYGANLERNLIGMEDSIEGPKAFSEKRKPEFKNR